MKQERSEIAYIIQDILPIMEQYDFPRAEDKENVKVHSVPVRIGSSVKKPDVVYYWQEVPVLILEAGRPNKSETDCKDQAFSYLKNFPADKKQYSIDGRKPKFIATAVGREIKFYQHKFEIDDKGELKEWLETFDKILTLEELLEFYGLSPGYQPKILSIEEFEEFLGNILSVYKLKKEKKITRDEVLKTIKQVYVYLEDSKNWQSREPYTLLDNYRERQSQLRAWFKQYDLVNSLNPKNAKVFRKFILRAFQGGNLNQYLTEWCVIDFMVDICDIRPDWKVLDFECGSGGFLASVVEKGVKLGNILGIDIDELPYLVAKIYLAIYTGKVGEKIKEIPIKLANGLFGCGNDWDLAIGNPAGGSKYDKPDLDKVLENLNPDLDFNKKPDIFSEYNFSIQQAVKSCKVGGTICLVLPEGVFTNSQNEFLRKYLAQHCRIFAIISLPRGVFKKGTETRSLRGGAVSISQKMSILLAKKTKEINDKLGLGDSGLNSLNYPVFLTSVAEVSSKKGEVCKWLKPKLDQILTEWEIFKKDKKGFRFNKKEIYEEHNS